MKPVQFTGPAVDGPQANSLITCLSSVYKVVSIIGGTFNPAVVVGDGVIKFKIGYYEYDKKHKYWKWKGWDCNMAVDDKANGWIGVDLDGTLAFYDRWVGWNVFGAPIPAMQQRVIAWLKAGQDVRIVTARVKPFSPKYDGMKTERCRVTGARFSNRDMINAIQDWTQKHLGKRLMVTCSKDVMMVELWDDRAVQVVANTGQTLSEEFEARMSAQAGMGPEKGDIQRG